MQNSVIQTYLKVKLSAFTRKIFPSILYRNFFIKYSNKQKPLKNYEVKAVTFIASSRYNLTLTTLYEDMGTRIRLYSLHGQLISYTNYVADTFAFIFLLKEKGST
jgi:hypothetical protein